MQIKILTLSFNPLTGLFDDSELQNFMAMHNVASVRDYFFIKKQIKNGVIYCSPLRRCIQTACIALNGISDLKIELAFCW